jgi:hypothetical protein
MRVYLALGASLIALACEDPADLTAGELAVRVTPPVVELTNHTPAPVYFFAIEGGLAIRANWAPCTDPSRCRAVAPAGSLDLAFSQIAGYHTDAETAIVYWWHLIPGGETGFRPDSIRAVGIRF